MKKIIFALVLILCSCLGITYSAGRGQSQLVDIYVCEEGIMQAELTAKVKVSRKELCSVSYCKCEGTDPSLVSEVRGMSCKPPEDNIYSCVCVGRAGY